MLPADTDNLVPASLPLSLGGGGYLSAVALEEVLDPCLAEQLAQVVDLFSGGGAVAGGVVGALRRAGGVRFLGVTVVGVTVPSVGVVVVVGGGVVVGSGGGGVVVVGPGGRVGALVVGLLLLDPSCEGVAWLLLLLLLLLV